MQRPLTSGPMGWPAGPTLQLLTCWLHGDTLQEAVEGNPKLKIGGGQTPWPVGHVARSAGHHLACYRLNHFDNPSFDPYKYPPSYRWKSKQHSLPCSSPLVKVHFRVVAQVKPRRESRVKSSIRLSSGSSLGDR
jgi:hypothetical protein